MELNKSLSRIVLMVGVTFLVAFPVFSQGNDEKTTQNEKLTVSFWDGNWNEKVFTEVKALWDAKYPDIELVGEFQIDNGMFNKYMLAIQSDTAPDVMACALDWVTTLANADMLAPLNDYIEENNIDTSNYVSGAIQASTIDGDLYGIPFRSETHTLFYNKDILAAAGYDKAPETWDELLQVAEDVTGNGVFGYGLCGTNFGNFSFQYINMLRSSGGSILTADGTKSNLDSDVAIQTAELYTDLVKYAPTSLLENDNVANRTLFASGKVAMYMSGIYDAPEIIKTNPELNFACAPIPTANGAERKSILGGWSVVIPKTSTNKDLAWKFVEFLTSPEVASIYTNTFTGNKVPAQRFENVSEEIVNPNIEALNYAEALPSVAQIVGIRQSIYNNLSLSLSDVQSPEEAMKKVSQEVNILLAE